VIRGPKKIKNPNLRFWAHLKGPGGKISVAQPIDSLDLLDRRGDGFHASSYIHEFAPYLWTYVAGYPLLVETFFLVEDGFANIRSVRDYIKGLRAPAVGLILPSWKARFPEGDWSSCNAMQIEHACQGTPLRFDKACQAVKALELAFAKAAAPTLRNIDFYKIVQLRPAIFVLRDLDDKGKALLRRNNLTSAEQALFDGLVDRLCPADGRDEEFNRRAKANAFLSQAADGYAMTYANAKLIKKYLAEVSAGRVRIGILQDRTDEGRMTKKKMCNTSETLFVSLDNEQIKILDEVRGAKTS
jgi:hypothetical protein